jgi:hypothetical protein
MASKFRKMTRADCRIGPNEVVINGRNYRQFLSPEVEGEKKARGLIPRPYKTCPVGYLPCAKPFDLPLIPQSEWQDRLDQQVKNKSQLSDVRNRGMNGSPIPSRDQNGRGYCWFHSGTSANLIVRAANNQPYADLSAYAGACIIKNYRDEGGWGSEGIEWQAENGCPTSQFWPQQGTSRSYDTPEMRANAKLHRVSEWMDLEPNNKAQLVTCLLLGIPVVVDFNWWSHSVCAIDLVSLSPFRIRIWNSWGDSWSENGTGVLEGSKASPDGQIAPRVITPAAA